MDRNGAPFISLVFKASIMRSSGVKKVFFKCH